MKFARIEMLYLIWLVPLFGLLFLYGMRRRRSILSGYSSLKALKSIAPELDEKRRWIKCGLILGAGACLVVALSGPQYGFRWQEIERRGVDIMLVLDCSKSMLSTDMTPTRLDRAKREIVDLLNRLEGDRVGLTAFAGTAFVQCPLTLDYETFHLFLKSLTPEWLPRGGTHIAQALAVAREGFDPKANSEKAIILITDGESTEGDPVSAAKEAQKNGIKIFTIGVGGADGTPIPAAGGGFIKDARGNIVLSKLDVATLKKISALTGGTYVRSVAGDMDLETIYTRHIRAKLQQESLVSSRRQVWEDRFQWPLLVVVLLLVVELVLPARKTGGLFMGAALGTALLAGLAGFPADAMAANGGKEVRTGLEYYHKGQYQEALNQFIEAQLQDPDRAEILYNLGNAYYKTGDFNAAANHYERVLKGDHSALKPNAHFNLGNTRFREGKYQDAIENYEAVLKLNPEDADARKNIEFVEKVMAQQKQQQPNQEQKEQQHQNQDQNQDNKSTSGQSQGENKPQPQSSDKQSQKQPPKQEENEKGKGEDQQADSQDSPPQQYGSEMKDPQEGQQPDPTESKPDAPPPPETAQAQAGTADDSESDDVDRRKAQRALERLKDMPGRAMASEPDQRRVIKDW